METPNRPGSSAVEKAPALVVAAPAPPEPVEIPEPVEASRRLQPRPRLRSRRNSEGRKTA